MGPRTSEVGTRTSCAVGALARGHEFRGGAASFPWDFYVLLGVVSLERECRITGLMEKLIIKFKISFGLFVIGQELSYLF